MNVDDCKRAAAHYAASLVKPGMVVGLGTGSTAAFMIERLGERVAEGLDILAIPTSEESAALARAAGIKITTFAEHSVVDITIDGADEVERKTLHLIKGLGAALLREKIVAQASRRFVVIVDATKPVNQLGERVPVPVEVVPFGYEATAARLEAMGAKVICPRRKLTGELLTTDNGNRILDCSFGPIEDVQALAARLDGIVGVVEHGLFPNMATDVLVATEREVEQWTP
ncbi:ribose-5-phosphate isomerase RpiA [Bombella saccharophila]|uniref:Ribose-5-phosphate isomerase A n=1 Tax=Bombella saccharophila TaxID=2967338 RepID=A0ABT3W404_9PROT|nr:ribose-5-phosphate isomerase RpiA [Bombella saccharophila]MCX5613780.1 ribose-5-phosphate isomerase RpiA [Bombella saccharophila]PHI97467.1 ribose 5-phosphate isomerase A [Parasaccharibacter apium]